MNFTITPTLIAVALLVIAVIVFIFMVVQLNTKLKKFLVGHNAETMGDSIADMENSLQEYAKFKSDMENYLTTVEHRLKKSVQSVHTVRFNPFKGTTNSGGNQSFATAFLDEHNNGVIISTLYAREHMSVFSKPIAKGISEYELSAEEKEALNGAMKAVK